MKAPKWEIRERNQILKGKGYYISYNAFPPSGSFGLFDFTVLSSDDGLPETALVIPKDGGKEFLILKGDFRKDYESKNGLEECIKFYLDNKKEHGSTWSTDSTIEDWLIERVKAIK